MFLKKLLRVGSTYCYYRAHSKQYTSFIRTLRTSSLHCEQKQDKDEKESKALIQRDAFDRIESKSKQTYLEAIRIFVNEDHIYRRGHVEFIYSAMKHMEEFGVHKDLEAYKSLIDVMPKGKFIPQNIFQAEFMHYPKQQQCIIDLLEQMEDCGVMPDFEMEDQLLNIFGKRGFPLRKYWRMMYWMPKFKNLSPFPVPDPLPTDTFELAKYAIERISGVDVTTVVTVYQTSDVKDSIDDTWIVSAQSGTQKKLLQEHDVTEPLYVEGPFKVWIKGNLINYFILRTKPKPSPEDDDVNLDDVSNLKVSLFNLRPPVGKHLKKIPSVHEQDDGTIFSLCATGTSSQDSLLSWIRHLENDGNPKLGEVQVVFTLKTGTKEVAKVGDEESQEKIEDK
ncbi:unnamed protein product [Acanthoscelides obtectus]|uniref:Evolutionarily conserved signaling intermediate in Toll pathway, mitochondrial n=1 Tax=Acanthoscelides obtectus TaxID=200917 RepID=A0A9P0KJB7_ACAOB|nr:unnamed protein product [Acanthoscelides obtectus]CAK1664207.1 Evolutionarily conserved signaling intermediate in Toll pathway, mitochondrial [Acanthoscelides obtectus]